jgi:uncharacterized membrane protein YbaN (DUF454 family)
MSDKNKIVYDTKRVLFIAAGFLSLGLAILGIILPILPTTPFLLLSAYCFGRGSEKWYKWLLSTKHFGKIISDYRDRKGVSLKIKFYALTLLWGTILTTIIFFLETLILEIFLLVIASSVSYHIIKLRTL